MIKIAFIIDTIESPTAGTEKQLLMLIKHLDKTRFQPYLCVLRSSKWLTEKFSVCELIDIGFPSFGKLSSYFNMMKFSIWMRKQDIDIVQTHFIEGNKVGILAGKLAGTRAIIATRRNQGYWHSRLELLFLTILNRWVTCFLANSENTRQWAAKTEGIDPQRIQVIHNGLEMEHFYKGTEDQRLSFREKLAFPLDSIIVGIVANLRPIKAIDVFIKAAKIVSEKSEHIRFIIIGDGPERDDLEALCNELGLTSLVRFLGKRLDVPEILSNMDIGVLSSNSESFSNSLIEYMAAGLAVVCTSVGGAREAIEDGVNGYIVEPGDSDEMAERISSIIAMNVCYSMGQQGRKKAIHTFSHEDVEGRYQQLYEEMK
jgi:L-malate glycosyltransferase